MRTPPPERLVEKVWPLSLSLHFSLYSQMKPIYLLDKEEVALTSQGAMDGHRRDS
jgi:hypothetical protein